MNLEKFTGNIFKAVLSNRVYGSGELGVLKNSTG